MLNKINYPINIHKNHRCVNRDVMREARAMIVQIYTHTKMKGVVGSVCVCTE